MFSPVLVPPSLPKPVFTGIYIISPPAACMDFVGLFFFKVFLTKYMKCFMILPFLQFKSCFFYIGSHQGTIARHQFSFISTCNFLHVAFSPSFGLIGLHTNSSSCAIII